MTISFYLLIRRCVSHFEIYFVYSGIYLHVRRRSSRRSGWVGQRRKVDSRRPSRTWELPGPTSPQPCCIPANITIIISHIVIHYKSSNKYYTINLFNRHSALLLFVLLVDPLSTLHCLIFLSLAAYSGLPPQLVYIRMSDKLRNHRNKANNQQSRSHTHNINYRKVGALPPLRLPSI